MTIKTLEERVGMTRANIRFYEDQGFLAPARLDNGYRDYSDADAEVLCKIKLFRRLHLDLDAIHRLQSGALTLDQALADQLAALEADQAALDRARQVCAELKDAGADWSNLDPAPWLEKLENPPVPDSPRYAPPADLPSGLPKAPDAVLHPWRRFFARQIDLLLCGLLWSAVTFLGFRWIPPAQSGLRLFYQLFNSYAGWGLLFLFEPLLLHLLGTTPGKALFAISVRDAEGNKLTWKDALRRTWGVFSKGCGYGIPIYEYWRLWKSYKLCQDGLRNEDWEGEFHWDGTFAWETYRVADDQSWRCLACVGCYVLSIGLSLLIVLQASLPPNRGALTEAELFENCNFYMDYLHLEGGRLDGEGRLVKPTDPSVTVVIEGVNRMDTAFSVTLTDGAVTGVTVTREAETSGVLWVGSTYQRVALLALAGSRPEVNALSFYRMTQQIDAFFQGAEQDYDRALSFASGLLELKVRQVTRLEHFRGDMRPYLAAEDGETGRLWQEFTVSLPEQ